MKDLRRKQDEDIEGKRELKKKKGKIERKDGWGVTADGLSSLSSSSSSSATAVAVPRR